MRVSRLKRKPKHFKNFTGLTLTQFDDLLVAVKARESLGRESKAKQRAVGGGRKAKLAVEEQLLVTLLYYRLYVTQILLGYLFDLDDSNISRLIGTIRPLLLEVLPLPAQETLLFVKDKVARKRISTLAELFERHPEFKEVLVDATEQETHKPKDRARRKGHYSGKKKRHTLKTQVTTSCNGLLLHVSRAIAGKVNDLTLLRGGGVLRELPSEIPVRLDRGYNGIEQDYPDRRFHQPHKARRNKPLDFIQKLANQIQNSLRIPVENALAHLKRFKLLAGIYRGPEQTYDATFLAISGLHNFRKLNSLVW